MKVLVPVDENLYSMYAIRHAARLAVNTLPEVVLLAMEKSKTDLDSNSISFELSHPKMRMLHNYCKDFLNQLGPDSELYCSAEDKPEVRAIGKDLYEEKMSGMKKLRLHLRNETPAKAILKEAKRINSDLIVLGCGYGVCDWMGDSQAPGKVAENADCSVLILKKEQDISKVVCCLDHAHATQESFEMINQLVTLYNAELEIVGVLKHGQLQEEVEQQMSEVLDYYMKRGIQALVKVVDEDSLEAFISSGSENELLAVWLSPMSLLKKLLSRGKVTTFVEKTLSSLLILR
ncbi:universal stress protein [Desulfovibrio sp. UCD-KL4C]|uniref:universal stress protein n=1 Tax=Desulfovibrio sp. UCD-KL4C TaxID=2578120 RepID=UPI0025C00693|nr:universal stress protein [Desulfovibrio sp. UCD-KL4C]